MKWQLFRVFIGSIVLVWLWYFYVSNIQTQTYDSTREELIQKECERRRQKQQVLDEMLYTESVMYAHGRYEDEIINELDDLLKNAVSNADDCEGIYYHWINIQDLLWSFTTKTYASESYASEQKYSAEVIIVYNSIVHLWLDIEYALHISDLCEWSGDRQHCYKFTVWVMKAESTLCKNASNKNNCFGMMHRPAPHYKRTVMSFDSHKDSITDFVTRYKKFRQGRITTAHRVEPLWNYCTDHCQHREWNVQYAINKMNKPLFID